MFYIFFLFVWMKLFRNREWVREKEREIETLYYLLFHISRSLITWFPLLLLDANHSCFALIQDLYSWTIIICKTVSHFPKHWPYYLLIMFYANCLLLISLKLANNFLRNCHSMNDNICLFTLPFSVSIIKPMRIQFTRF